MKERYTHAALAAIITLFMYGLSFSVSYLDSRKNFLFVLMMLFVMSSIGYFYSKLFYEERGDSHKK